MLASFVFRGGLVAVVIGSTLSGCGRTPLATTGSPFGESCGTGITSCGGACTDLRWDPSNCGFCGRRCSPADVCRSGTCTPIGGVSDGGVADGGNRDGGGCPSPRVVCGGVCTDVDFDAMNCGACGRWCLSNERCSAGRCAPGCTAPTISCSGVCVDVSSDFANCGACGRVCGTGQTCTSGSCGATCPSGRRPCGNLCVDLSSDDDHCGGCDVTCALGERCERGLCRGSTSVWPTLGADLHHTGYNPNERGRPPLTLAWSANLGTSALWPAVSDGSRLYVTSRGGFNPTTGAVLTALAPATGNTLWTYNFGAVFSAGQPTVSGGFVYVAQSNNSGATFMFAIQASNGGLYWSQPFGSQWEDFWAPLVVGERIYANGGTYGGLYAWRRSTGVQLFFNSLDQWDQWSPLYLDDAVFTFTNGNLRRFHPVSGLLERSTKVTWLWAGYDMKTSPVSDGTQLYVISPPNLIALTPDLVRPVWTANGAYASEAAVADGVVYAISGGHLRANDAATGTLLWSFAGDGALAYPPVVAAGHVYVASDAHVYAVDVATHMQAWSDVPGGWLSIAGGQLLVAANNGILVAWALTQP